MVEVVAMEREMETVGEAGVAQGERAALEEALAAERGARAALEGRLLATHRRALLAEQRGQMVEDLVQGDSIEALDAAVEPARAAHARIAAQVRASQAALAVPVGNAARTGPRLDGLSPQAKIAAALRAAQ